MSDISKLYDPSIVEPKLAQKWIDAHCYRRSEGDQDCTVTIPPPNVTGVLHMGHAMGDTIQDTFVRYNRMRGRSTRWIVGIDHAGIATQTQVDKKLASEGISRRELGREKFLEACHDWREEYGGVIIEQTKRMGCSVDFDDEKFTMSPEYELAVRKVFCDWYHDGLIYQGKRIVNWCPKCTTAISDDEAEYMEEKGHFWYFRYPLAEPVNGQDYIVIATTRPETMLGDTGVAVAIDDSERAAFVGHEVIIPIVNRRAPIFADWHVKKGFGSGFVKVTPAHDPNDYEMGKTHNLEQVNIFDEHARVVEGYGKFSGMTREEARKAVVAWFDEHGLLDHIEEHTHDIMHCYRCGHALEPWLSEQWFLAVEPFKEPAIKVVDEGKVTFHADRWKETYISWMRDLKDWCISRQLWWGHRIPVFYCDKCGWTDACMEDVQVCPHCGSHELRQDEDVLDTWFSSQLWTFATQGWPEHPEQMKGHHPTKVLVTARDIIALWVARMVMSSLYFIDEIPFDDVVIYATILAKDGSRMSKSKGNGVNPMDLIEKYGADAMRYNLLTLHTNNQDVRFDADIDKKTHEFKGSPRTEAAKGFVTKIWNASRFALMNLEGYEVGAPSVTTPEDAWMFSRLAKMCARATTNLETYAFGDYARSLQTFFWGEVCDWYIELCKGRLASADKATRLQAQRNIVFVLDVSLRLMHPVMPFVTEAVWQLLPESGFAARDTEFLMMASWPEPDKLASFIDDAAEREFERARQVIMHARSVRARYGLRFREELDVVVRAAPEVCASLERQASFIASVGHVRSLIVSPDAAKPSGAVTRISSECEIYLVVGDLVDLAAERAKLEHDLADARKSLSSAEDMLANKDFVERAAPEVVATKRERVEELTKTVERLEVQIADIAES